MTQKIHKKRIKIGELDIHYLTGGQGTPLIVIHGGSGGAKAWLKNMAELAANYTVYAPDLPGFGHSQPIDGDYYIPELAEFVDKFSQALGLDSFHLMGHSFGGGIVLHYALEFPQKIKKLVLVSSLCLGKEIALWVRLLSNCVICRGMTAAAMTLLRSVKWLIELTLSPIEFVVPYSRFTLSLGKKITTFKEQTTVLFQRLSEVLVPTLVVWGEKDPIVPARQAYAAAELIPDCQVKVFEGSGHSVYRDEVAEFSRVLTKFLG